MNEKVFMAYFQQLSKNYKSSNLWAYYSMLKSVIVVRKNVDIGKYTQLICIFERQSVGYKPKKSKIFTKNEVVMFLKEADDKKHMLNKVSF